MGMSRPQRLRSLEAEQQYDGVLEGRMTQELLADSPSP